MLFTYNAIDFYTRITWLNRKTVQVKNKSMQPAEPAQPIV